MAPLKSKLTPLRSCPLFCSKPKSIPSSQSLAQQEKISNEQLHQQQQQQINEISDFSPETLRLKISDLQAENIKLKRLLRTTKVQLRESNALITSLQDNLEFIKENKYVFEILKETYMDVKYNESLGKKTKKVRNKSVQTWDGILCRACLETEKLRVEIEKMRNKRQAMNNNNNNNEPSNHESTHYNIILTSQS